MYSPREDHSQRSDTSIADSIYRSGVVKDLSPAEIVRNIDFHLFFLVCFITTGAALALLDNLPQLVAAVAPTSAPSDTAAWKLQELFDVSDGPVETMERLQWSIRGVSSGMVMSMFTSEGSSGDSVGSEVGNMSHILLVIFSVSNTLGRIIAGFWPEHSLQKHVRAAACLPSSVSCSPCEWSEVACSPANSLLGAASEKLQTFPHPQR
jgi:hypothetical protein